MPSFKIEFATVKELEKKTYHVFGYGGGAFAVGFLLMIVGLGILGVPLMAISGVVVLAAITWVSMLGKEPVRPLFCPYCSNKNDVYQSRRSFNCDICARPVLVTETGEVAMANPIDTEARYDR